MDCFELNEFANTTFDYEIQLIPLEKTGIILDFENCTEINLTSMNITKLASYKVFQPPLEAIILFLIILTVGIFGNIMTCIVIFKSQLLHNATNYYLFNLAVSDMIILITGKKKDFTLFTI